MEAMEALDGPFAGKLYVGVPHETKTLVDNYRTFENFYEVTYQRTDNGWKFVKETALLEELLGTLDGEQ
jgi:hypothetical protein